MSLTPEEVHRFFDLGYLVKPGLYTTADLQPLKDAIATIVDTEATRYVAEGKLTSGHDGEGFERRLACIYAESPETGVAISAAIMGKGGGGFSGGEMLSLLRHPPLVDCICSLVGPDVIGASAYRIRIKMPGYPGGEVPWHQDSGYFLPHCDHHLMVTCWIPLVDATLENGCLYVIPCGHRSGILRHYTGGHAGFLEIPGAELPAEKPVPIEIKAGGALFLTNLTPHASFANRSSIVRWSIDLRYQGVSAPNNIDEAPETYTPEREMGTMACHPSEADFVIRDTQHPGREISTPEAFKNLRDRYENARPYSPGRGWTPLSERKP
ncbi:MAG: phytanoyl-CoA dioxygenase family protein [candidate division Zixibacteria bacterium]|nr:phytanoyl-CoA dioxygenase family protein [candidate division Zixibacteria bacterium]